MLKVKHLVLAAVVILVAGAAMANNFRAADQVYIPIAGHAGGGSGLFLSDVFIQNVSSDPVTVSYIFIPIGDGKAPQYYNDRLNLAAGERRELIDFLVKPASEGGLGLAASTNPLGAVVFNACRQGADCTTVDSNGFNSNYRDITVFSRIYAVATSAPNPQQAQTTGQAFSGIPWYNYASMRASGTPVGDVSKLYITGFRQTGTGAGTYRSNFGLMNASQYSTTTLVARLYNGNNPNTAMGEFRKTLGPLGNTQVGFNAAFGSLPAAATSTNLFIVVEQESATAEAGSPADCGTDGCAGFLAYGSVLDQVTSDATTLEAVFAKALSIDALTAIYGSKPGGGGPMIRRAVKFRP